MNGKAVLSVAAGFALTFAFASMVGFALIRGES